MIYDIMKASNTSKTGKKEIAQLLNCLESDILKMLEEDQADGYPVDIDENGWIHRYTQSDDISRLVHNIEVQAAELTKRARAIREKNPSAFIGRYK